MKIRFLTIVFCGLFLFSLFTNGQILDPYESLKRGSILRNYPNQVNYNKLHTDSVPYYFEYFLKNVNNKDTNYGLGIYYAASYYYQVNNFLKSDSLYELFLDIDQPNEYVDISVEGCFGHDIDPYNYYHFVYEDLCDININLKEYRKALAFINQASKCPAPHFCGNASLSRPSFLDHNRANCYIGLNLQDSALKVLLPHIFNTYYGGLRELLGITVKLLKEKYKEETKEIIENSFKNIQLKKVIFDGKYYNNYSIQIDNVNIYFPGIISPENKKDTDYSKFLWNSDFYNLIKN